MSIVRLIHISSIPPRQKKAVRVWKTECAPAYDSAKRMHRKNRLGCRDAHEFISYSEWESETDIATYTTSAAHQEIVRHARALKGSCGRKAHEFPVQ